MEMLFANENKLNVQSIRKKQDDKSLIPFFSIVWNKIS